jgi:hypothetical protein
VSMTAYIALLRAVNVGGTGKLPMSDLKAMCEKAGFGNVRTYTLRGQQWHIFKRLEPVSHQRLHLPLVDRL